MSRISESAGRYLATRSRKFWTVAGAGVLTLSAAPFVLPLSAFAKDTPVLVSNTSASTTSSDLTVSVNCPSGRFATGVTAELGGAGSATINQLAPQGRRGVAGAHRVSGSGRWTLKATAVCVRHTADLEVVTHTFTIGGPVRLSTLGCGSGKELIGFGWQVEGGARVTGVGALPGGGGGAPGTGQPGTGFPGTGFPGTGFPGTGFPGTGFPGTGLPGTGLPGTGFPGTGFPGTGFPGTGFPETGFPGTGFPETGFPGTGFPGTGFPGTGFPGSGNPGTGNPGGGVRFDGAWLGSNLPGAGPDARWNQTLTAVCATPGHGTWVTRNAARPGAGNTVTAQVGCPPGTHANAVGFSLAPRSEGQAYLLTSVTVDKSLLVASMTAVRLDPPGGERPSVEALCTMS